MIKLTIHGELFFLEGEEDFGELIERYMGREAAEAFETMLNNDCCGECDEVYRVGEHFERVIQGAVDELELVEPKAKHAKRMEIALKSLRAAL